MRALKKREVELRRMSDESTTKDEAIYQLQQELEYEQVQSIMHEKQPRSITSKIMLRPADSPF